MDLSRDRQLLQVPLSVVYQYIQDDAKGLKTLEVLSSSMFEEGTDCILHFASRKEDQVVFDRILAFLKSNEIDVDLRDATYSTALEIAIRKGMTLNVVKLLNAGASPHQQTDQGATPLHTAIMYRTDWSICNSLLQMGADPNVRLLISSQQTSCFVTALDLASHVDRDLTSCEANNQLLTINALLNHAAEYEPNCDAGCRVYENLFAILHRSPYSLADPPSVFIDCLRMFLANGSDPCCQVPQGTCHAWHCSSLAQFVFFHGTNDSLLSCLIGDSDLKSYGQQLVTCLLEPCPWWATALAGPTPSSLVLKLIKRGVVFPAWRNPICTVFAKSPDAEKASLTRTLLMAESASIHTRDSQLGRPLAVLAKVEEPLCLELAEILLIGDLQSQEHARIFIYDIRTEYHKYTHKDFKKTIVSYLNVVPWHVSRTSTVEVEFSVRCIIHVLTQRMINDTALATPTAGSEQRLQDALAMRKKYKLQHISPRAFPGRNGVKDNAGG